MAVEGGPPEQEANPEREAPLISHRSPPVWSFHFYQQVLSCNSERAVEPNAL